MQKLLLIPAFYLGLAVHAQTIRSASHLTYTRLTAYSQQFADVFSAGGNLGALPAVQRFSTGVYSERRFGLAELGSYAAALAVPAAAGTFAMQGDYLGSSTYNESSVGLAYGRNLGSKVAVGVRFNYFSFRAAGYGDASVVNADAGLVMRLTPQLNAGLQACNPMRTSWSKEGAETLPAVYRAGLGYDVSQQVYLGLEAEKTENLPISFNAGLHYLMAGKLVARAGLQSATATYYLGFGLLTKGFRLDVTASLHPYLGLTPGLLLLYSPQL